MEDKGWEDSPYREEDWAFYKALRDSSSSSAPKRLTLFSGADGSYWRKDGRGKRPGDAFHILAPTPELVDAANENSGDYHDASYVFMYRASAGRIILSGDSHDATWEHIVEHHEDSVRDVELLVAPHHGRASDRSYEFLDVLKPRLTLFGNAPAKDMAYDAWRSRGLEYITNNQAGTMVVDTRKPHMSVYVTNESFARDRNRNTTYSSTYRGWYLRDLV